MKAARRGVTALLRALAVVCSCVTAAGCNGTDAGGASGSPDASAPSASTSTSASTAAPARAPTLVEVRGGALPRRKEPKALRLEDETGCERGDAAACRRLADRHRGYGAPAGCGVDRGRAAPSLKRSAEDTTADLRSFQHAAQRACSLGDTEACTMAELAPRTRRMSTALLEDSRFRSKPDGSALWRWARESRPKEVALVDIARKQCATGSFSIWGCWDLGTQLYRHGSDEKAEVPAEVRARALAICRDTLECDDVLMMLDMERYPVAAVAPVRAEMGSVLAEACLDGACVCGQAAKLLSSSDERHLALAEAGCRDGEAEACYELARAIEDGHAGPANLDQAMPLYRVACPGQRPLEQEPGPRQGEYSPRACDRLAQLHERGESPPKEPEHALWYARAACQRAGQERDHAPCLRLARYYAHGPKTGRNIEDANLAALGAPGNPVRRRACERPSVAEACAVVQDEIAHVRR